MDHRISVVAPHLCHNSARAAIDSTFVIVFNESLCTKSVGRLVWGQGHSLLLLLLLLA